MAFTRGGRDGGSVSSRQSNARPHIVAALFLLAAALLVANSSNAGDLDRVVFFNIEAQTLDKALLEFGAQAHVQIMFAWNSATASLHTQALRGNYTGREALTKLLKGTRLSYVTHQQTVEIVPKLASHPSASAQSSERIHVQRSDVSKDQGVAKGKVNDPPTRPSKGKRSQLEQVVITGSRIPTAADEGPQEVLVYDREKIDQSGQTSIADFLSTLPAVPVMSDDEASGNGEPYSTVRLRGLPAGTTLLLLNGRRLENSGLTAGAGTFFNLDDIPLAAVQRIEIDADGSSAVYGSDAIGGVVNIILKKNFDGFAANAKYGWAKDTDTVRTDLAAGKQWRQGGLSVIASYDVDSGLLYSERFLTASQNYTAYGGPDNNFPVCFPGNVFSSNGKPLPGAPAGSLATYAAITGSTSSGKPGLSQFAYGVLNNCSILSGAELLPSRHRAGVLVEGHFNITPDVQLFTEVLYTYLHQAESLSDRSLFGIPGYQEFTVSASNPYNPFGETVGIAELLQTVPVAEVVDTSFFRTLVGARGMVDQRWQWEVSAWQSNDWNRNGVTNELADVSAIQSALNSSDPSTALNPFVSGPIAPQSIIGPMFGNTNAKVMARDRSAEAFVRGPVLELPGGNVEVVLGGDYVQSILYDNLIDDGFDPPSTRLDYRRRYSAQFGEAKIPVARGTGNVRGGLLTLTVAGRHDHYSDFGSANTYQLGLELRPTNSLLFRGTYADAFDAPTLTSLYTADTTGEELITDPATGTPQLIEVVSGGNRKLRPMTGRSRTLGIVYSSQTIRGLLLSITQWMVSEHDVIQPVAAQVIVDNAASFPGRVIRDPTGRIVEIDDTYANFGTIDVAGVDYQFNYALQVDGGRLAIDVDGTETYRYRQALVAGATPVQAVSTAASDGDWAPRWKGTVGVGWKDGAVSLHLDARYTGSYQDYDSTQRIGNFWIGDANVRLGIGEALAAKSPWLRDSYVEAGATNVFNRGPQFSNYGYDLTGYDPTQMSIVGRSIYVAIGARW